MRSPSRENLTNRQIIPLVDQQAKDLKTQNALLALQLDQPLVIDVSHSDDHYRSESSELRLLDVLAARLRGFADADFTTEEEKLRWSASYLSEKPRNQW